MRSSVRSSAWNRVAELKIAEDGKGDGVSAH